MKIDICIPSLNRIEKLTNCVNSIIKSKKNYQGITLKLYFNDKNDLSEIIKRFSDYDWIKFYSIGEYCVPNFWNNLLYYLNADALCYMNDDILFYEDTIEEIYGKYQKSFPDNDGILGINQANLPKDQIVKAAFGVIGTKYANRFPDRKVFCPDYKRFYCDLELNQYAEKINKFSFYEEVRIQHLHPVINPTFIDYTHKKVREHYVDDMRMWNKRKMKGLLWGESFVTIGE